MEMHEIEVWVLIDEDGSYVCRKESDELADAYDEEVGGDASICRRAVKLVVKIPVPSFVTLTGTAPAEGEASLTVEAGA